MNADEFVEIVRKGSDKLRVDEVVLKTADKTLHGKGMLIINGEEIALAMTITGNEIPPELKAGVYTKKDFWKLSGIVEDHLEFKCDSVLPRRFGRNNTSGLTTFSAKLDIHPLELIPDPWDLLSDAERANLLQPVQPLATSVGQEQPTVGFVRFEALLADYPLLLPACDSGTKTITKNLFLGETEETSLDTLSGEVDGFDFGLVKNESAKHLRVVLRSKEGYNSPGEEQDWRKFHAFLETLAFIHGVHALPYRTEYWRDGRKMVDRVTTVRRLARTAHFPITERLVFTELIVNSQWNLGDLIKKVTIFFESQSELSKEIKQILFLFRQAGDEGVHAEITIIVLCALFENLVRLLYRVLDLETEAGVQDTDLKIFKEAKEELQKHIARQVTEHPNNKSGYDRLKGIVHGATPLNTREVFKAVVCHLGLKWENDMEDVFRTWKNSRNPLFHDKTRTDQSEDDLKQSMIDESRIAGAINILLMKLFEYSGPMRTSSFEDAYRQI